MKENLQDWEKIVQTSFKNLNKFYEMAWWKRKFKRG